MSEQTFKIVYPVNRLVTESEIRVNYSDAVANGECEDVGPYETADLTAIMAALSDSGEVTFGSYSMGANGICVSDTTRIFFLMALLSHTLLKTTSSITAV